MITRSRSSNQLSSTLQVDDQPVAHATKTNPPILLASLRNASDEQLYTEISAIFLQAYGVPAKELQVQSVIKLIQKKKLFFLPGQALEKHK